MRKFFMLLVMLALLAPAAAQDDVITQLDTPPDPAQYQLTEYVGGLTYPISMSNANDGSNRLFILEQPGIIQVLAGGQLQDTPFLDISALVSQDIYRGYSERGLMGLAFHPQFAENGQFFVHYSDRQGNTVLARYTVSAENPNTADPNSAEVLLTHPQPYPNHNGGQLAFGPDGYLYMALGDGGSAGDPQNNAQNPSVLLGKILRLDVDGEAPYTIPEDNPANTVNANLAPEIWAWGLRNPWRFSFDSATGDLYIADVGQNQWEEINFQPADSPGGENYGWRIYEGTHRYTQEQDPGGTVFPIAEYDHSQGCSVTGGYVYRGEELPGLQGVYFYSDYCSGNIWATYRDSAGAWQTIEFMRNTGMSVSSLGQDDAGELYFADYRGRIMKLVAAS